MTGSNGRGPDRRDLSNWGVTDSEVLAIVDDLAREGDGWATTYDVRVRFGEHPEETGHRTGVPSRLSWLRRYGWLERNPDDGRWGLTEVGDAILERPRLPKSVDDRLDGLNLAQQITLTRRLADAGVEAPQAVQAAIRRQWQHSQGRWRR